MRQVGKQTNVRVAISLVRKVHRIVWALGLYVVVVQAAAQGHLTTSSLCDLQVQLTQGEHRPVRVEGVFLGGIEGSVLVAAGCSNRNTNVEFQLKSQRLWKRLNQLSNKTSAQRHAIGDGDPVRVVFEGEFYGPPVPDPKLPEKIRKIYHPAWDNQGSMTKLVVHSILSVKTLPVNDPCARTNSDDWPCYQRDPALLPPSKTKTDGHSND
jgi:hypothetical protein